MIFFYFIMIIYLVYKTITDNNKWLKTINIALIILLTIFLSGYLITF